MPREDSTRRRFEFSSFEFVSDFELRICLAQTVQTPLGHTKIYANNPRTTLPDTSVRR
jgi:hypothetical protein